ncbi:hypothetical protein GCM10027443_19730 [Pontibacter brevis]
MRNNDVNHDVTNRLVALSELKDYKVASDSTDVLGWKVAGADGDIFGIVKDLIVDPQSLRVRYLNVVADRKFFNTNDDQFLLIPIGAAALDKRGKKIFVSYIDSHSISRYPLYSGGVITEDYEYAVRDTFQHSQNQSLTGTSEQRRSEFEEAAMQQTSTNRRISDDFYNHDNFNENRFYSSNWQDDRYDTVNDSNVVATDTNVYDDDVRTSAEDGTPSTVEDSIATIERLEQLRKRGSITDEEFTVLKKRALDI